MTLLPKFNELICLAKRTSRRADIIWLCGLEIPGERCACPASARRRVHRLGKAGALGLDLIIGSACRRSRGGGGHGRFSRRKPAHTEIPHHKAAASPCSPAEPPATARALAPCRWPLREVEPRYSWSAQPTQAAHSWPEIASVPAAPHDAIALCFGERLFLWQKEHNFRGATSLRGAPRIGSASWTWRKRRHRLCPVLQAWQKSGIHRLVMPMTYG